MMNITRLWLLGMIVTGALTIAACGGGGGGGSAPANDTTDPVNDSGDDDVVDGGDGSGDDTDGGDGDGGDGDVADGADDPTDDEPTEPPPSGKLEFLSGETIKPSKIRVAFQALDGDGVPVPGLTEPSFEENFLIEENGADITTNVESFTEIVPASGLVIPTVFVIDISNSISDADLQQAADSVRAVLIDETDPDNPVSRLEEGQLVGLLIFDGDVTTTLEMTHSPRQIQSAFRDLSNIDRQRRTDPNSTNLYGAAMQGLAAWEDRFTSNEVIQGYMILVTDGADTANSATAEDVIAERDEDNARVFTVPIGDIDSAAQDDLDELASQPEFALDTISFDALGTEVVNIADTINDLLGSLYKLEYITSSRSGAQKLAITHTTGDGQPSIERLFLADDFGGQERELVINQQPIRNGELLDPAVNIPPGGTREFTAETLWTQNTPDYDWSVVSGSSRIELSQSGNTATVTAGTDFYGTAKIEVTDLNNANPDGNVSETFNIHVTDKFASALFERTVFSGGAFVMTLRANPGEIEWTSRSDRCRLRESEGNKVELYAYLQSTTFDNFDSCNILARDPNDTSNEYSLNVWAGPEGKPLPVPITADGLDFEPAGFNPESTGEWQLTNADWGSPAPETSGERALRARDINPDESSTFSVSVKNASAVSFDYRVSSELRSDYFTFSVDGVPVLRQSGETNWQEHEETLDGGEHILSWEYARDEDGFTDHLDSAIIDNIVLEP